MHQALDDRPDATPCDNRPFRLARNGLDIPGTLRLKTDPKERRTPSCLVTVEVRLVAARSIVRDVHALDAVEYM